MIVKSKFSPNQHVRINDADQPARVIGVLFSDRGISYICRWWDGENFQENEFGTDELTAVEQDCDTIYLCGSSDSKASEKISRYPRGQN